MRSNKEIALQANELLTRLNLTSLPIDVDGVARGLGIAVHYQPLEDEVSGMLVVKDGTKHIIVNSSHHPNRRRFTTSHEIGHLVLHHKDGDQLFVDTKLMVYQRAGTPSSATYISPNSTTSPEQEREANIFAASLLMPESILQEFIDSQGVDISDEFDISRLASAFGVSEQAMSIRLKNLNLVEYTF